jgi:hypothetical protein
MALDMSNATYARDESGRKKLIADLQGDLKTARTAITGNELTTLLKEVDKYWSGADATKFKNQIKTTANNIANDMKMFDKDLESALSEDTKSFSKLQSSNATSIGQL